MLNGLLAAAAELLQIDLRGGELGKKAGAELPHSKLEASGGGGFAVEGRDGFDEARDGEGVANAAGTADEVEPAALARQRNGELHEGRDAGTVNLRDVVQVDNHLPGTPRQQVLGEIAEVFTGFTDGETAVYTKVMNAARFARRDFQWWMERH